MSERQPNSMECTFGGYKLSSVAPEIQSSAIMKIDGLFIGCEEDDTFYTGSGIQGRVEIKVMTDIDIVGIDLEDVLVFARKYCAGIYDRVSREVEPYKEET